MVARTGEYLEGDDAETLGRQCLFCEVEHGHVDARLGEDLPLVEGDLRGCAWGREDRGGIEQQLGSRFVQHALEVEDEAFPDCRVDDFAGEAAEKGLVDFESFFGDSLQVFAKLAPHRWSR